MEFFLRQLTPVAAKIVPPHTPLQLGDRARAIDILARTIWGEGRGETLAGREAVASVVINRVRTAQKRGGGFWWGNDVESVCLKPYQFSCWNENDPNRRPLLLVDGDDPNFAMCLRIARRAVQGILPDNTGGADHYHADTILPKWALDRVPTAVIGNHIFYKLEG